MCAKCLILLATLLFSAFPTSTQERGATPRSGATIVERLRSELQSVLHIDAFAAEDVSLPVDRLGHDLTRADGEQSACADTCFTTRAVEMPIGFTAPQRRFRRGSTCWWLWLLFGHELCTDLLA